MPPLAHPISRRLVGVLACAAMTAALVAVPLAQGGGGRGGQQGGQGGGRAGGGAGAAGQGGQAQGGGRQNRDPTQQATGTAAITGTVSVDGAGTPVRRARVTLTGAGQHTATTDDKGNFSFTTLPAGRFTLRASKAGYVDMAYGAKRPGRQGTPIQLADGQRLDKAVINLPKGSVVTGIVLDENHEPSPGTQVRVLKFAMRTGEKTLEQSSQDTTDDRGMYRIYGLQPGDYLVSAMPRVQNNDAVASRAAEIESLRQQIGGGRGGAGGGRAGAAAGGAGGGALANALGGRGQQILDRLTQLQAEQEQDQSQNLGYAPVYFPGTIAPASATTVTLGLAEERSSIDFQLQLLPLVKVSGTISSADGALPGGTMIRMIPIGQGVPTIPGAGGNIARADPSGKFTFVDVAPGQYTVMASAVVRDQTQTTADPNAGRGGFGGPGGPGGRGGRGGPGNISQVLWAATDVNVSGQNLANVGLNLQPGMTITGTVSFESGATPPTDLTRVRVNLQPMGDQVMDIGGPPSAQADATGHFTIKGVAPGKYSLRANVQAAGGQRGPGAFGPTGAATATSQTGAAAGNAANAAATAASNVNWTLKSAITNGRDALDYSLEIKPNEDVTASLLFTDKTQQLSGILQDASGRPTADYTIIVFAQEPQYWLPQARRIAQTRPGTDGKFTLNNLPAGQYRLTAVTDAEPGEWYDPEFLKQLLGVSIPVAIHDGEKKTQDIKLAGGGGS